MMLWLASASRAGCAARAAPAAGATPAFGAAGTGAAACTPAPARGAAAGPAELPEQPASMRAAPDISPAHVNAVMRSGPRDARTRAVVFMSLGRTAPGARFRRSGHGPVTDGPLAGPQAAPRIRAGE